MADKNCNYLDSLEFKMIIILSCFRSVMRLGGSDFVHKLWMYRASKNEPYCPITMNTVTLIDVGFEQLSMPEVRIYSDYIAKEMKYDEEKFFETLKAKAVENNDTSLAEKHVKKEIAIMHEIIQEFE